MFCNKRDVELNVKINTQRIDNRKTKLKDALEEIWEIKEEHPDIKIYVEVNC